MNVRGLLLVLPLAACGTPQTQIGTVDGHEVDLVQWADNEPALRERASFELNCPSEDLEVRVLDTTEHVNSGLRFNMIPYVTQAGVVGCGRRQVYVWSGTSQRGQWVLNSDSQDASD